jgi:hypothetical protein
MAAPKRTAPPAAAVAQDAHWAAKMEQIRSRQPIERSLRFPLDDQVVADLQAAEMEHLSAVAARDHESTPDTEAAVEKALRIRDERQAALDESSVVVTFRALPRPEYEALQAAHPPTEEQRKNDDEVNIATLAPALVAACSTDDMTEKDATELLAVLNSGEATQVWETVQLVNRMSKLQFVR